MAKSEWDVVPCAASHPPGTFNCDRLTPPEKCDGCSWNPEVEAERRRQLRAKAARGETPHATKTIRTEGKCAIGFHWRCRNCYAKLCPLRAEARI